MRWRSPPWRCRSCSLNERYLEWSVLAGGRAARLPGLALPGGRGRALRRAGARQMGDGRAAAARDGPAGGRVRRSALVLLSIPGGLVSDVGFASLAGATEILDGRLPYGNLPPGELVHGDTYPLLAYLAYVPAALVDPVRDGFDTARRARSGSRRRSRSRPLWRSAAPAAGASRSPSLRSRP